MLILKEPDPFLQQMYARMAPGAKFRFSPSQIDEIKRAFGARTRGSHAVDFRRSISLFGKSYYVVFLAGRERRAEPHLYVNVTKLSHNVAIFASGAACCLLLALTFWR